MATIQPPNLHEGADAHELIADNTCVAFALMAGAAFSFIPNLVIFVALQRYIVQGIALTGFR